MVNGYANCPYCDEECFIENDEPSASEKYEEYCPKCKKKFEYNIEFSVDFYTSKIKRKEK